ncbi:hypothetical protein CROQUDRAFT_328604 [Cronartium quercuum f. sp. fusiforme G11]|uniref:Uncharacterized protein n=1 Tax=Cronartium quercuum f. sp. fusiforme G11 TaxID=708437 RepID=A0A9P6TG27_9BASI|nr:hypothetical protein CROQUDRAFT_328604 [Cronartium quercuum f. sp. fusiforme G11]
MTPEPRSGSISGPSSRKTLRDRGTARTSSTFSQSPRPSTESSLRKRQSMNTNKRTSVNTNVPSQRVASPTKFASTRLSTSAQPSNVRPCSRSPSSDLFTTLHQSDHSLTRIFGSGTIQKIQGCRQ